MSNTPNTTGSTGPRKLRVVDPHLGPRRGGAPEGPRDIRRTKEYKAAARRYVLLARRNADVDVDADAMLVLIWCRWTAAIVALPIALYTSYVLYDRSEFPSLP